MNDSLNLRNRILKMREDNNLSITKKETLNNNLMSKFESSIKDDNQKKSTSEKEILSKSSKSNSDNLVQHKDKSESKNIKSTINDNEAKFLMLANKFNEAVEVILELSHKVEKLEKNATQNTEKQKIIKGSSFFLKFKIFVFLLLIPTVIIGFFTFPFDFSIIKSIINDILSTL